MTDRVLPPNAVLVPKEAARVFKGQIFDVYQWKQQMFDGTFETFEMLKRPDSVVIIAVDEGRIVLLQEEQPDGTVRHDSLPKGRVDPKDATILAAAKRELLEETGMEFEDWYLLQIDQPQSKIEWFVYTYVARSKTAQHKPTHDAGEKITVELAHFERLKQTKQQFEKQIKAVVEAGTLEEFLFGLQ